MKKRRNKIPDWVTEWTRYLYVEHKKEEPMNKDKTTLKRIKTIHPILIDELNEIYDEICKVVNGSVLCRFSSVYRSYTEQKMLYDKGRTKPGKIVTNAKPGFSYHNYGLAVDIVLLLDRDGNGTYEKASWSTKADYDNDGRSDWQEIVAIFKQYGWEWGGEWRFKDDPHFQKTLGHNIKSLQKLNKVNNYVVFE